MKNMIEVNHIHISLGKKKVLNDLTFHVEEQEIFGFLGPSGAGKTTTIKILTGQLLAGEGDFFVDASKDEIGILSDNTGAYERLTVYRNVLFFAELANVPKKAVSDVLKKVKLWEDKDKKVKNLSKGMKQRLYLACAIVHKPRLLFLDEPTAALDPATTEEIHELLRELQKSGTTIFLTTHNMEEADELCDRVAFLNKGKIVELGKPAELKLKYAKDIVKVSFKNGKEVEVSKDAKQLMQVLKENSSLGLRAIHSEEANLAQIFLSLTGRELK